MTVSSATYRNDYTGNGSTTVFAYTFKIQDQAHVEVILVSSAGVETTQTITTNYSVSGVGDSGGNITMVTAPASGESLVIRRKQPFVQETDYVSGDPFPAETHETALDELTLNDLHIKEVLDRCVQAPNQDSSIARLPTVTNRANKMAAFTSGGDITNSDFTTNDVQTLVNSYASGSAVSDASAITYTPAGSGAVATNVQAKLREVVSVTDFGAVGDGAAVDNTAIQAAIDYASTNKKILLVPTGTYLLEKGSSVTDEGGTAYPCLLLRSNLHIIAEKGAVFKIADDQSTNGAGVNVPLLYSIEVGLENITIDGLTFDSNSDNQDLDETSFTWSQFGFSGSPTSSTMAYANDVLIQNCIFKNNPGATCIGMSQSENTSGTIGKRWTIKNNFFYNNGYKCYDHSSIYGYAEDVLIDGNTFDNPDMFGETQILGVNVGGQVAYEVHGANTRFVNNKVKNYAQGMWLSSNRITDADNIIIDSNTFSPIRERGIATYRQSAGESPINKVVISNNTCGLDDRSTAQFKSFVDLSSNYAITNVLVTGNLASKVGTTTNSSFVAIGAQNVAGQKQDNIQVVGNTAIGFCFGVYATTTATNGLGSISIHDNTWVDLDDTAAFPTIAGIAVNIVGTNTIDYLSIVGNTCKDSAGVCDYGININAGTITYLHVSGNSALNMAIADYIEGATITNRSGEFTSIAFTPTLNSWTNVGTPTFTGSQWSMSGKIVTVNILIQAATSISSTLLTSTITGLPFNPTQPVVASCVEVNNGNAQDNCVVTAGGVVYTPTTGTLTGQLGISFTYSIA